MAGGRGVCGGRGDCHGRMKGTVKEAVKKLEDEIIIVKSSSSGQRKPRFVGWAEVSRRMDSFRLVSKVYLHQGGANYQD